MKERDLMVTQSNPELEENNFHKITLETHKHFQRIPDSQEDMTRRQNNKMLLGVEKFNQIKKQLRNHLKL